jgi:hypothetical protein
MTSSRGLAPLTWSVREQEKRVKRREVRKVVGEQLEESYREMLSTPPPQHLLDLLRDFDKADMFIEFNSYGSQL